MTQLQMGVRVDQSRQHGHPSHDAMNTGQRHRPGSADRVNPPVSNAYNGIAKNGQFKMRLPRSIL